MNTVSKSSFSLIAIEKGFPPWEAGLHHEGHGSTESILSAAEGLTTDYEHEGRNKVNGKEIFTAEAQRTRRF